MVRFVLSPGAEVAPDFSGKLPGRGAWVSARRDALEMVVKSRGFSRAFKAEAKAPDDLVDRVEAGLARKALDALGLARRVGDALTGFEKVRAGLAGSKLAVLIAARDGAADGRGKLAGMARGVPLVALFDEGELSGALGRDVVHAGIIRGEMAEKFLAAARRLEGFRGEIVAANRE